MSVGFFDALTFLGRFIKSQWTVSLPYPTQSFDGQTVIVTGSNTGLGREAAHHFVRLGAAKVIIAVRSLSKGEEAQRYIEQETGRKGVIEVWHLDLSSYDSVKSFATQALKLDRIDVLLENAAISTRNYAVVENHESTITVNVVSTFLLALLLLPKLRETAKLTDIPPRLTVVSSEMHFVTNIHVETAQPEPILKYMSDKSTARMMDRYAASKLLELLIIREIVKEHAPAGYPVVINTVNPGFCHSELMRETTILSRIMKFLLHARSSEVGSRTLVDAAGKGKESHGQYLSDLQVAPVSPFVQSELGAATQARVWSELKEQLETIQPGILKNF